MIERVKAINVHETLALINEVCGRVPLKSLCSLLAFSCPFSGDGLLVVVQNDVLQSPSLESVRGRNVLHMRRGTIWEIAVPNPWEPETLSMPFWIREAGQVLYGENIRPLIPEYRHLKGLLANHLEVYTYRTRSRLVLSLLQKERYQDLFRGLAYNRALLMATALLTRGIWRVYPDKVRTKFISAFGGYRDTLQQLYAQRRQFQEAPPSAQPELARRRVWLHEQFVRSLWALA
jgi:hypothetical protein